MKKLRLLMLSSDTFPPKRVDVAVLFGEELADRGHRVDVVLQSESPCGKSYTTQWPGGTAWVGATDLRSSLFHRVRKHVMSVANDLRVFSLLRRHSYDAVVVKDKFIAGIFSVLASRLSSTRFIFWLSYPFPEASLLRSRDGTARYPILYRIRGYAFKFLLYRLLLPSAAHVFVQSEQMLKDVEAEGIAASKMTAVPMGVQLKNFELLPAGPETRVLKEGGRSILYLGTLIKVRRMDFLVRVFARVRKRLSDATLYFVGGGEDPSDEAVLVEEAKRLNVLDEIVFVGQLPQSQALRYVSEADVCVSPFFPTPVLNSTSPTKLIEYMALGKAVVANDHPEQRLVIEESGAGICVPYDEDAFAEAIVRLLSDPTLATACGLRGREYVEKHRTYGRIATTVEQEFLRAVSGPSG